MGRPCCAFPKFVARDFRKTWRFRYSINLDCRLYVGLGRGNEG